MALRIAFHEGLELRRLSALPEAVAKARERMGGESLACASPAGPSLILGYQQSVCDFDLKSCAASGVGLGRRFCAGDAFLLGKGDVLFAFSTTCGARWSFRQAVDAALRTVADSLRDSGVDSKQKLSAVLVNERRLAAATATRKWGGHLICGYVLVNGPIDPFAGALMLSQKELAANYGTLRGALGREVTSGELIERIGESWCRKVGQTATERSGREELEELDELAQEKYSQERWLGVR